MRLGVSALALLCHFMAVVYALYEDQAGKWDWRMQWIGRVVNLQSNGRLLLVASELNVVAAINAASGAIIWRHVLDEATLRMASRLVLVGQSVNNGRLVYVSTDSIRCWSVNRGVLKWQTTLPTHIDSEIVGLSESDSAYIVTAITGRTLYKYVFDASNGQLEKTQKNADISWIADKTKCDIVGNHMICIGNGQLYSIWLDSAEGLVPSTVNTVGQADDIKLINCASGICPYFLLMHDTRTSLYKATQTDIKLIKVLDDRIDAAAVQNVDSGGYFTYVVGSTVKTVTLDGLVEKGTFEIDMKGKENVKIDKILAHSTETGLLNVTVIYSDATMQVLNAPDGKSVWTREEALAYVVGVEMLDLPLSEGQAQIEEEFAETGEGVLLMLKRRLQTQGLQLQRLALQTVDEIMGMPALISKDWKTSIGMFHIHEDSDKMHRDLFNLRKMIVLSTSQSKVFGVDCQKGKIVWSLQLPLRPLTQGATPKLMPYILRSTAHYPFPAIVAFVGKDKLTNKGKLITVEPMEGKVLEIEDVPFSVKHVVQIDVTNADAIRTVVLVGDKDNDVFLYPKDVVVKNPIFLLDVKSDTNTIRGYRVSNDVKSVKQVWQSARSTGASNSQLVSVNKKKFLERTHSQGRVLGDRNVLYKYSNPNLVAIVSSSADMKEGGHQLHIDLVDSVTGLTLFSALHTRAYTPVTLVHCENWIVYTYWNEKARRTEIAVLELYEGREQASPHYFSSLVPTAQAPMVMRQGYIFPQGVTTMGVTDTEMGMSNRHLLLAMPFGGILELPKAILDPRRIMMPVTPEQREEGMIPYMPELRIATDHIINYNQTVLRIKNIHAAHTGLESTSLILAYGLDLYFTRLNPSGTFDVLNDDFDHWIISSVLAALLLASIVTKRLARRRDLTQAWK